MVNVYHLWWRWNEDLLGGMSHGGTEQCLVQISKSFYNTAAGWPLFHQGHQLLKYFGELLGLVSTLHLLVYWLNCSLILWLSVWRKQTRHSGYLISLMTLINCLNLYGVCGLLQLTCFGGAAAETPAIEWDFSSVGWRGWTQSTVFPSSGVINYLASTGWQCCQVQVTGRLRLV